MARGQSDRRGGWLARHSYGISIGPSSPPPATAAVSGCDGAGTADAAATAGAVGPGPLGTGTTPP